MAGYTTCQREEEGKGESERDHDFEYFNDLRILKRFVQAGSFGYKEFDDEVFRRLSNRYPEAYAAFGRERKQDVLEKNKTSPYIEGKKETYPNNPDKPHYMVPFGKAPTPDDPLFKHTRQSHARKDLSHLGIVREASLG